MVSSRLFVKTVISGDTRNRGIICKSKFDHIKGPPKTLSHNNRRHSSCFLQSISSQGLGCTSL